MKIQVQYILPVLFKPGQKYEMAFRFCGTISLPALPPVGTKLWEFESDDPDTAEVESIRLVPEEGDTKRLAYEIRIMSDSESVTEWSDFDTWFRKKVRWLLGLGLQIVSWPSEHEFETKIGTMTQFILACDQAWYERVVSGIQTEF